MGESAVLYINYNISIITAMLTIGQRESHHSINLYLFIYFTYYYINANRLLQDSI